ncbi:hypothetical protein HAX54_042931, partial [Datura stramonium]|nr:hypothetical protein [Datura stramonium]
GDAFGMMNIDNSSDRLVAALSPIEYLLPSFLFFTSGSVTICGYPSAAHRCCQCF